MGESLPVTASSGGNVALTADGAGIATALESIVAHFSRDQSYDDVVMTLHSESAHGVHKNVFSFRAYRRRSGG